MAMSTLEWAPKVAIFSKVKDYFSLNYHSSHGVRNCFSIDELTSIMRDSFKWIEWANSYSVVATPGTMGDVTLIDLISPIAATIVSLLLKPPIDDPELDNKINTVIHLSVVPRRTISHVIVTGIPIIYKQHNQDLLNHIIHFFQSTAGFSSLQIDKDKLDVMINENNLFTLHWEDLPAKRCAVTIPIEPVLLERTMGPDFVTMRYQWRPLFESERKVIVPNAKTRDEWAFNTLNGESLQMVTNGTILCVSRLASMDSSMDSVAVRILNWYLMVIHKIPKVTTIVVPFFHYLGEPPAVPAPQLENIFISYLPLTAQNIINSLWSKLRISSKDKDLIKINGWPFEIANSLKSIHRSEISSGLHFTSEVNKPALILRFLPHNIHMELIKTLMKTMLRSNIQLVIKIDLNLRKEAKDGQTYLVIMNSTSKENIELSHLAKFGATGYTLEYLTMYDWFIQKYKSFSNKKDNHPPWEVDVSGKHWRISRSAACSVWCNRSLEDYSKQQSSINETYTNNAKKLLAIGHSPNDTWDVKLKDLPPLSSHSSVLVKLHSPPPPNNSSSTSSALIMMDMKNMMEKMINEKLAMVPKQEDLTKVYNKISQMDSQIVALDRSLESKINTKTAPIQSQLDEQSSSLKRMEQNIALILSNLQRTQQPAPTPAGPITPSLPDSSSGSKSNRPKSSSTINA